MIEGLGGPVFFAMWLMALAGVAFIQNAVFTLVSRSRNGADFKYHRYCAWGSNGIWLLCQTFIWRGFWEVFNNESYGVGAVMALVYTFATAEGSVFMMKMNLGVLAHPWLKPIQGIFEEKGRRQVAARAK
jgi:hypothetical protein